MTTLYELELQRTVERLAALREQRSAPQTRKLLISLPAVKRRINPYNKLKQFIAERCETGDGYYIRCSKFIRAFREWLGDERCSTASITLALGKLGYSYDKNYKYGLRLK